MSRKLDALFAERVLGHRLVASFVGDDIPLEEMPSLSLRDVRPYTTSLDAAWEGVEKLDIRTLSMARDSGGDWCYSQCHTEYGHWGIAPHPALAIVLACLRAVGVTEEEIEEAKGG